MGLLRGNVNKYINNLLRSIGFILRFNRDAHKNAFKDNDILHDFELKILQKPWNILEFTAYAKMNGP